MTSPGPKVAVLDYGIGNLRSAQKALQLLGADAELTSNPATVSAADAVILPGVGAFGACMAALRDGGVADMAIEAAASGRPFLGICVGMQLLYESSTESPDCDGLGILKGRVVRLTGDVKVPQMQWNQLKAVVDHPLLDGLDGSWMYFVHSYAAEAGLDLIASCDYGGPVTAAVAQDNVWATQFHPEKSARSGQRLLANWLNSIGATNRESSRV